MKLPDTKIALTLYSLREYCRTYQALDNTFEKLRDIGYQSVQISGIGNIADEEVKDLSEKHSMYICAAHENFNECLNFSEKVISKLKLWECSYTAVGIVPKEYFVSDGVTKVAPLLEKIGRKLKSAGITFGYHNHHWEFMKGSRIVWLMELFDRVPSDVLAAELDLHWIVRGGGNPEAWIRYLCNRVPVLHFKDFIIVDGVPHFCEIGEGNLDWQGILNACFNADVRWYVVEQDQPFGNRDIFESLQISFENLKQMGVK